MQQQAQKTTLLGQRVKKRQGKFLEEERRLLTQSRSHQKAKACPAQENLKIIQKRRLVLLTHQNQRHSWLACHLYMGQTGRVRGASVGENAVCAEIRVRNMYAHISHTYYSTHTRTPQRARARAEMFRRVASNSYFRKRPVGPSKH